ncbi:MAG: tRNA pseudouridine(38-40) synthase TruA [Firmicutes bacterium HGW-Firmicutes-12]|jgi:tRNA pseudouridine38-40 synthase|nr:MAG: tRNA pseudouridine(38-40) synthase TruA [Firmicutes bacterium HGW-Firmicutes-12]
MRNIKMTLSYDGTQYHGFQVQKGTRLKTVQGELEKALRILAGEKITIYGSGRTDAGVHALGQVINFNTISRIPEGKFAFAMNSVLPRDIVVWQAEDVSTEFHARYSAKKKTYCYTVYNDRHFSPFWRQYAFHIPIELDFESLSQGAKRFHGEHDFSTFCSNNTSIKGYVRTIYDFSVEKEGPLLKFTVTGSGFLFNMVRIMTGTLLEIGEKKKAPEDIVAILAAKDRRAAGMTLPPQGLCLHSVEY